MSLPEPMQMLQSLPGKLYRAVLDIRTIRIIPSIVARCVRQPVMALVLLSGARRPQMEIYNNFGVLSHRCMFPIHLPNSEGKVCHETDSKRSRTPRLRTYRHHSTKRKDLRGSHWNQLKGQYSKHWRFWMSTYVPRHEVFRASNHGDVHQPT